MSAPILEALENLLASTKTRCYDTLRHNLPCGICDAKKKARTDAQSTLDAVPVLEWVEHNGGRGIGPYMVGQLKGPWYLMAFGDGNWCVRHDEFDDSNVIGGCDRGTLDDAMHRCEDAMRALNVMFRTVAK